MEDLSLNWVKWRKFAEGKQVVSLSIDEYDIFGNTNKYKTHRDFIEELFREKGLTITQFGHRYGPDGQVQKWGLVFERGDSDIRTIVIIKGIIGVNLERIHAGVV